jgi:hypothetical protein
LNYILVNLASNIKKKLKRQRGKKEFGDARLQFKKKNARLQMNDVFI